MKKFMTVLLVIAVMFTFSFGSAFAAINYNADNTTALITAAQTELAKAKENLDDVKDYYLRNYKAGDLNASGVNFTKAAVEVIIEDAFDGFEEAIVAAYEAQIVKINGKALSAADMTAGKKEVADAIAAEYAKYDTAAEVTLLIAGDVDLMADLMEAQFDIAKAEALAELDKVNYANYSTELPDAPSFEGKYLSKQQIAQEVVKDGKEEIEKVKFDEILAPENYITYFFDWIVDWTVDVVDGVYYVHEAYQDADLIPTVSNEAKVERTLAEEKAYQVSVLEGKLALKEAAERKDLAAALEVATEAKNTEEVKKINTAIDELGAKFDAAQEGWTYQLNAKKTVGDVQSLGTAIEGAIATINVAAPNYTDATLEAFVARAKAVDAVTALAAKLTAQTGFDGAPLYDAETIADALEADIDTVWFGGTASAVAAVQANADLVKAEMNRVLYGTNVTLNKVVYPVVEKWADYITTNIEADSDYEEEAEAIVAETEAAIRAAETVADVDAAFVAGYEKLTAVTKESVKTKYQASAAAVAAKAKYETLLGVAYDTKVAEAGGDTEFDKVYDATKATLIAALVAEFADAYNAAELDEAYKAGLAEIEGLKTEAELKAEQKALNDAILAIKAPVTAADEAAILALVEDVEDFGDYVAMIGAGSYTVYDALLTQYFDAVEDLATDAIDKAITAIGTVTVEDEAAIEALEAMIEAYEENGYDDKAYDLTTMKAELMAAKIDAVEDAIAAINPAAEPLDMAAIKAAREAYAALGENTIDATMYAKMLSLENLMAAKEAEMEAAKIQAVEALKITAKSSAKKGSITVKWTVVGDTDAVEGYEIWKSTKKNSGFKKAFTATKMSYKNTKGLKKGTRYFYKVRAIAYTAEGVKVKSDWSNKAYRVAK